MAKSVSDLDWEAFARVRACLAKSQSPTTRDAAAYRKVERVLEAEYRDRSLAAMPKTEYCRYADRQVRTVNAQAVTYGAPIGDESVDVRKLILWLHDFLADNASRLRNYGAVRASPEASPGDDDLEGDGEGRLDGLWLERNRKEATLYRRLKREQEEGRLVSIDRIRPVFVQVSSTLRKAGEMLERRFGPDASDILQQAINGAEREALAFLDASGSDEEAA